MARAKINKTPKNTNVYKTQNLEKGYSKTTWKTPTPTKITPRN
jgi:hypothetical protein